MVFTKRCLLLISIIILHALLVIAVSGCDLNKYNEWKSQVYNGPLSADATFWIYQTQKKEIFLTNYLALELAVTSCTRKFDQLYYYLAGRMGPIDIQHSYKIMCRSDCLENDAIHESAMAYSGCSCLELSTQPDSPSYHIEGDFCRHNSARLLCDKVGYCGSWDCRIDDFMCPRYEWNKKLIPYKGIGSCERGFAPVNAHYWSAKATVGVAVLVSVAFTLSLL